MTTCFRLMRTHHPDDHQERVAFLCEPCVYFSKNLDPSLAPSPGPEQHACGLGFAPGDEKCAEMRTNSCGMRRKKG